MRKIVLQLIIAVAIAGISSFAYAGKADLVVATDSPPKSMNPHAVASDANMSYISNFFDGLLQRKASDNGRLSPALATSWERTQEKTWKFTLRKGVKFSNGNDFNAEDVRFTFERMKDPKYSQRLNIANAVASIETPDDYTIIFNTVKPIPWFAATMHLVMIVDKESSEKRDDGDYNTVPIGTGAYTLEEWVRGSYVRMKANPDYWDGAPKYKTVEIRPITEDATRFAALAGKQVDIVNGVPGALYERVSKMRGVEVISKLSRRCIYLGLSNSPGTPLEDIRVRKAIAHAINEDEIIDKIMNGLGTPAAQISDPPTLGYLSSLKRLPYDPEKSKALLKAAGYENGFEITLGGPNDRYINDEKICEAVAKYLAKVNIRVNLDVKPKSIYFDELKEKKFKFYLLGWFDGSYDAGRSSERLLHSYDASKGMGTYNGGLYSNPELDKMIIDSSSILDTGEREKMLQAINKKSLEDLAAIPLHYQQDLFAVVKGKNIKYTPRADRWVVAKEIQ